MKFAATAAAPTVAVARHERDHCPLPNTVGTELGGINPI